MIYLHHIEKQYDANHPLLKIERLIFPEQGLVGLFGPSGCGKTTLLNIIAGLDGQYQGKVEVNHHYLSKNPRKNERFRLEHIGYIMQHYGLFEEQRAIDNVMLPAQTLFYRHKRAIYQRAYDLLNTVGLAKHATKLVKLFSGGEKQRIAIARALMNQPRILLADEPTGALDSQNKIEIMQLLSLISKQRLVIVVSHDLELLRHYADRILTFDQGQVKHFESFSPRLKTRRMAAISLSGTPKQIKLPLSFIWRHHYLHQRQHPIQSGVSLFASALGLLGIGLGLILSTTVTGYLKNNLKRAFPQQSILIETKEKEETPFEMLALSEVSKDEAFSMYSGGLSLFFNVNYEQFFPNRNRVVVASTPTKYVIESLSIRQVNEVSYLNQGALVNGQIHMPYLESDQVVLGVHYPLLNFFYSSLKLPERSIDSLRNYIHQKGLTFAFELENKNWQYEDEQLIEIKEVVLTDYPRFYHCKRDWNQWFLQTQMRFPSTTYRQKSDPPWMLYEQVIIHNQGMMIDFVKAFETANPFSLWVFETFTKAEVGDDDYRFHHLKVYRKKVTQAYGDLIKEIQQYSPKAPIIYQATNHGYIVYKDALLSGFAHPLLLSTSEQQLDTALEKTLFDEQTLAAEWHFDPGIAYGHYLQTTRGGFDFNADFAIADCLGRAPTNINEIVISTALARKLGLLSKNNFDPVKLYGAYVLSSQNSIEVQQMSTRFSLSIVGLIQSDQLSIYQDAGWIDQFFRYVVDMQNEMLLPNVYVWLVEEDESISHIISTLNTQHKAFIFTSPTNDVFATIDATMHDIQRIIFAIASIAILISLLLSSLVNYLSVNDSLYQIGLLGYLGVPAFERIKLFVISSLFQGGQSFLMASFELLILQQVIQKILRNELGYIGTNPFQPEPYIVIAFIALAISLLASILSSYRLNHLSPIEAMRRL